MQKLRIRSYRIVLKNSGLAFWIPDPYVAIKNLELSIYQNIRIAFKHYS